MKTLKRAIVTLIVAATAAIATQPAQAAPLRLATVATGEGVATNVHYRHRRHYHRRYYQNRGNGAAIAGALIGGAVIGGIIANSGRDRYYAPRRVYVEPRRSYRRGYSNAHIRYCYNRYRSYRAYDNTFQPYHGPRRQCRSGY